MKLRLPSKVLLAAALGLASAIAANAQVYWFDTGQVQVGFLDQKYTANGTVVAAGNAPGASQGGAGVAHQAPGTFPNNGTWAAPISSWLMPALGATTSAADGLADTNLVGIYAFQTSFVFDSTVYNLATSSFGIQTIADNKLWIYDNGTLFATGSTDNFTIDTIDSFTLNVGNGLVSGLNTITIYVENLQGTSPFFNPTGFRLDVTEHLVPLVPVPEPSTYGLIGAAALLGLVVVRRIRSKSAIA
jgi:PEP-CTERM motif